MLSPARQPGQLLSPDGQRLATFEPDQIRLWNSLTWEQSAVLKRTVPGYGAAAFSDDGRLIAFSDRDFVKLFDAATLREVARLSSPLEAP